MTSQNLAVWLESAGAYTPSPALEDELSVDIAVIGGGVTGLATAWHLRRDMPAASVAVLEASTVGEGASGRNNGILTRRLGWMAPAIKRFYGKQRLSELLAYNGYSFERTRELIHEFKMDCDHRQDVPQYTLAVAEDFVPELKGALAAEQSVGLETAGRGEWIDAEQLAERYAGSMLAACGAVVKRDEDVVNPVTFTREYKRIAVEAGAAVFENSPAIDIRLRDGRYRITTPQGALRADKIVLATNAHTHQLAGDLPVERDQWPMYVYKIATEPLSDERWAQLGWEPDMRVADTLKPNHNLRRTADGRLTSGSLYHLSDRDIANEYNAAAFERLERYFRTVMPNLSDVRISHRWGGVISTTFDIVPHIGFVDRSKRVFRISGCWGHGMATAYLNGEVASKMLREESGGFTEHWTVQRKPLSWPVAPVRTVGMNAVFRAVHAQSGRQLKRAVRSADAARAAQLSEFLR